jgi:hypothetical protein
MTLQKIYQSLRKQFLSTLNVQNILFTVEENAIHQRSKAEDPSKEFNPQRFGLLTDNPHRHRRNEEANPDLHIGDNKSKA